MADVNVVVMEAGERFVAYIPAFKYLQDELICVVGDKWTDVVNYAMHLSSYLMQEYPMEDFDMDTECDVRTVCEQAGIEYSPQYKCSPLKIYVGMIELAS